MFKDGSRNNRETHERTLEITSQQGNESCYLSPVRRAIIQKSKNNSLWWRCGDQGILIHWWRECKLVQSIWKIVLRFLGKLRSTIWHSYSTPENLSKGNESSIWEHHLCFRVCSIQFTIARIWSQPKCTATNEWIKKIGTYFVEY